MLMESLLKKPSAWIPIVLPIGILLMLLFTLWATGLVRQEDEGLQAHIFQLWLVLEVVMICFFALTWLPRAPKQALFILLTQIAAAFAACFPVFYFNL